jgi:hypothetical protein
MLIRNIQLHGIGRFEGLYGDIGVEPAAFVAQWLVPVQQPIFAQWQASGLSVSFFAVQGVCMCKTGNVSYTSLNKHMLVDTICTMHVSILDSVMHDRIAQI